MITHGWFITCLIALTVSVGLITFRPNHHVLYILPVVISILAVLPYRN
jgi:hypothetical protein